LALRLAFFGTAQFAVPSLAGLLAAGHEIAAVYTQPPRPKGRGHKVQPSLVAAAAARLGLTVHTPVSLKPVEEVERLRALALDVAVVAAYGLLLPPGVLAAPRLGCVNVHGSLLPRWRGAAPIQHAILAGDAESGVTIMQMDAGLDTGPILTESRIAIAPRETTQSLHDKLAELGARAVVAALAELAAGRLVARPQPSAGVTHASKFTRADGRLDWRRPALDLDRRVRALGQAPGVWFPVKGEPIKVHAAQAVAGRGAPGEILSADFLVACGEGALALQQVQRPGRAGQSGAEFLRGFRLGVGATLDSAG
jgi:methionyl-tRNA formyltransferase